MWLLIDANNWYAADYYAAAGTAPQIFCNRLRDVLSLAGRTQEVTRVVLAFDSDTSFRRDMDSTYKSHRRQKADDYWVIMGRLKQLLCSDLSEMLGTVLEIEQLQRDGFEADDILAAMTWRAHHEGERVLLCSSDKDLHALLAEGEVSQATKIERKGRTDVRANCMTAKLLKEKYGVAPHQWVDYRCMVGDSSDGLKGCEGIGPTTAVEVLRACHSLDGFWRDSFRPDIDPKKRLRLINFKAHYPHVKSIISLRADCLDEVPA